MKSACGLRNRVHDAAAAPAIATTAHPICTERRRSRAHIVARPATTATTTPPTAAQTGEKGRASTNKTAATDVGHFFAYTQSLPRNTVGYDGPIAFFVHPHWDPAMPAVLLSVGYVAVLAVLTAWLFWMAPVRWAPDAVATGAGDESVGPLGSPA